MLYRPATTTPRRGSLLRLTLLSARSDLTNSVLTQDIPGFLPGLSRSLLFLRCHGGFLLFFSVTFSFFRHSDSPDS